jgi:aspartyl/asparaginyl beta-hydroxylase (cupin superfamily)
VDERTENVRNASSEASALLASLTETTETAALEDFTRQATFISERLQSIAVDISRVLETQVSEDDWRRFNKGEKGIFVRKLLGFREKTKLQQIRQMYQEDGTFRDYVTRYLKEFEKLLDESAKRDTDSMLHATFLSSDMGKVYMILARALDRDN